MPQESPQRAGNAPDTSEKLFLREEGRRARASGLPSDVLAQSARRLRILAFTYAFVFFMSGVLPALVIPHTRVLFLSSPIQWAPATISILMALLVAALTRMPHPAAWVGNVGLAFEVVSSYGIATAEFLDPSSIDFNAHWVGLSWVAAWVLSFAAVVPSSPRRTALATLASVSAVPVVIGFVIATNPVPDASAAKFFVGLVFPYLLITLMATVGSHVVYSLGREITRARELGGYRLVERLGAGGMGEVWRAEHRLLARPAAIKLVRPEALGGSDSERQRQLQERFNREAQVTAMMRSPHTIELFDFGMANDGTFYYVMELLEGFDLGTLVERFGPVPAERAIGLLAQVCQSLGEAHAEGLIHRDVKPANVYACRYGRQVDFVKVLDFGMVKWHRQSDVAETQLTGNQAVWGTPAFMAPEQILGTREVDARADLYAVGCLAYWLVTGHLVFEGRTAMELMSQHAQATPAPPSSRTEIPVPLDLETLILGCLAKNPDDRPASADALADRLESIPTPSPWTTARAREWWDRHHPTAARASAVN